MLPKWRTVFGIMPLALLGLVRFVLTLPYSLVGVVFAVATRGHLRLRKHLVIEAVGCRSRLGGVQVTIGSVVINRSDEPMDERRLRHETVHVLQWALIGPLFPIAYAVAYMLQRQCNVFERWAGFADGGYEHCLEEADDAK